MRTYNGIERPDFTPEFITELKGDEVFVFGSNLAGMHGGGAAYIAFKQFGALMGCGVGLRGQSYANSEDLEGDGVRQWLLESLSLNNLMNESSDMRDRILFEKIPSAQKWLSVIVNAMRDGRCSR